MKVVLKKLVGNQWAAVPITDLVGQSISSYLKASKSTVIAALYEGEEPMAFMSNDEKYVQLYKAKGLSLSVDDLEHLVGRDVMPSLIAKELEGSSFAEIKVEQEMLTGKK